jgi:hypothetical protein
MPKNSWSVDPVARESEVIAFLDSLPVEFNALLIGGYAVAAYGPPRYSADVDLILPGASRGPVESWLRATGVEFRETLRIRSAIGRISKLLISHGPVSGDLYFGGLRARESGVVVDYDWIAQRPTRQRLTLMTGTTRGTTPAARLEALWVLKLLAGRSQDITDLFAISERTVDSFEIRSKLQTLQSPRVRSHLRRVASRVRTDKEYLDALSRRGLGSPRDPRNRRRWERFKQHLADCLPP